jgi:hypothetical protein
MGLASMKEMGIEILLAQKLILKKSKKRYFSEWSREGIEKSIANNDNIKPLEKLFFIKL